MEIEIKTGRQIKKEELKKSLSVYYTKVIIVMLIIPMPLVVIYLLLVSNWNSKYLTNKDKE